MHACVYACMCACVCILSPSCVCYYVIVLSVPALLPPPVLAELRQADLIASDECKELSDISDVVRVQHTKSLDVMTKTAAVFRRLGYEKESKFLSGKHLSHSRFQLLQECVSGCGGLPLRYRPASPFPTGHGIPMF